MTLIGPNPFFVFDDAKAPEPAPPEVGDRVFYTMSQLDADYVNRDRERYNEGLEHEDRIKSNYVCAGAVYPATVTATFSGGLYALSSINLVVQLDGEDTYWATSRKEFQPGGFWHRYNPA